MLELVEINSTPTTAVVCFPANGINLLWEWCQLVAEVKVMVPAAKQSLRWSAR